ncbi:MAG: hypothetical protein ABW127_02950 [Candidatus Thiodiazotropha endolucinida]
MTQPTQSTSPLRRLDDICPRKFSTKIQTGYIRSVERLAGLRASELAEP